MPKGIDYSKWDKIVDSSDEDEDGHDHHHKKPSFAKSTSDWEQGTVMKERCNNLDAQMADSRQHLQKGLRRRWRRAVGVSDGSLAGEVGEELICGADKEVLWDGAMRKQLRRVRWVRLEPRNDRHVAPFETGGVGRRAPQVPHAADLLCIDARREDVDADSAVESEL